MNEEIKMSKRIPSMVGSQYRYDYERGWRASLRSSDAISWQVCDGWVDGYRDESSGREKWHSVRQLEYHLSHHDYNNCDCEND